jgi:hypothetical protein
MKQKRKKVLMKIIVLAVVDQSSRVEQKYYREDAENGQGFMRHAPVAQTQQEYSCIRI